ncbi:MAG: hypothetical protein QW479_06155 [Desulfurococcaceae archaeon]
MPIELKKDICMEIKDPPDRGPKETRFFSAKAHVLMKVYSRDPKELASIIDRVRLTDGINDASVIYVLRCVKEGIIEV